MSYNQLPLHLKPCFLYMGVSREDCVIRVSEMVQLWIAEGFIKPVSDKTLEEVGQEYMKALVDRNLILVHKLNNVTKMIKFVKIHDLLRDLCLRQAQKERFYNVVRKHSLGIPQDTHSQRRLFIRDAMLEDNVQHALLSMSLCRSLIGNFDELVPSPHHRLLRILDAFSAKLSFYDDYHFQENQLVNLRYYFVGQFLLSSIYASSMHLLWNLQTLIIMDNKDGGFSGPAELWSMPHLRHVKVKPYLYLSNSCNEQDELQIVLENLQTLTTVINFKCGQDVLKSIPNIKKLAVQVIHDEFDEGGNDLSNLDQLHKLESFACVCFQPANLTFPHSIKKLNLHFCCAYYSEDMMEKIGSLPLLQKFILQKGYFRTTVWETVEGQFSSLKVLKLRECGDLKQWRSESSHFPCLERLVLGWLPRLNEIPSGIGEIETLQSIVLKYCCESVVVSAKRIQEEQEELHQEEEVVRVRVELSREEYEAQQGSASPKFELSC